MLTWPLVFGIALQRYRDSPAGPGQRQRPRLGQWAVFSLVPLAAAGLLLATYNGLRFGDPLEFGYQFQNVSADLSMKLAEYGQFDLHYLPQNLWAMLLAGPELDETLGVISPDRRGMSLLLTTPAIIFLWRARRPGALVRGAWVALVLLLAPLLLYYNTGWVQFGYRFSLEFMIPVMVLLAVAVRSGATLAFRLLVSLGVMINAAGTIWWLSL